MNPTVLKNIFGEGLLQLIYPPICIVCENLINSDPKIPQVCFNCLNKTETVSDDFIKSDILEKLNQCFLDGLRIFVQFDICIQTIVHHIKYQKMNLLGESIAQWILSNREKAVSPLPNVDLVLPVPLYPVREKERGFNQSYFIARGLFSHTNLPVKTDIILRNRHTKSQTELSRDERIENVSNAFRLNRGVDVTGKRLVLVDDVVTTGATINECARTLKNAGAASVYGFALATPV